jgi:hypothetical protein
VLAPFSAQDRFDQAVPSRELIGGTNTKGSREEGGTKAHKDLPPYPNRAPTDVPTPCKLASNDLAEQKYALVLSPLPARDELGNYTARSAPFSSQYLRKSRAMRLT